MNTVVWIIQILLALAFFGSGFAKAVMPREKLVPRMGFVNDFPQNIVKLIGVLEVLGAIGLILPALTGVLTWLTPLAAVGLVLTMIGALAVHVRRNENNMLLPPAILLLLALFVAYERFVGMPL